MTLTEVAARATRVLDRAHTCGGPYDCVPCDVAYDIREHLSAEDEAAVEHIDAEWAEWLRGMA